MIGLFQPHPGLARHDHPDTAHAAAVSITPCTGTQRRRVLGVIVAAGTVGITDESGALEASLDGSSYRPRRVKLANDGLIERTGVKMKTLSGLWADCWGATKAGIEAWRSKP